MFFLWVGFVGSRLEPCTRRNKWKLRSGRHFDCDASWRNVLVTLGWEEIVRRATWDRRRHDASYIPMASTELRDGKKQAHGFLFQGRVVFLELAGNVMERGLSWHAN
jgi:hypothetical protein